MKILFVLHADFERPGYFEIWAKQNGYSTQEVKPYQGEELPDAAAFDFLIVMGGPQSPLNLEDAPYLRDEINLIQCVAKQDKSIIGICLGAQLIGEALGARTEKSPHREIGAYPIELLNTVKDDPIFNDFPKIFNVMHWHNDMPGMTNEAVLLAKSEGCPRQIIRYGRKIYGFQCHLELTEDLVKGMIENCPNDLSSGKYVQTNDELMMINYAMIHNKLQLILNRLVKLI